MDISALELFKLWADHSLTKQQICNAAGITMSKLYRLREKYKLPHRPKQHKGKPIIDPTQEQIAERAAEVRASWSPEVERQRRVFGSTRWRPPAYDYDSQTGVFSY